MRSISSKPSASTFSMSIAASATSRVISPPARTWAKSRTRRSRRLAMRGVPRERLAISLAPSAAQAIPRMPAERRTIRVSSSGE